MWRFRTGSPWRDMPADHDAWTTAYHRVLQWHDLDRP
ncbi:transposase [Streptomyces aurantiacus]